MYFYIGIGRLPKTSGTKMTRSLVKNNEQNQPALHGQ